MSKAVYIFGEVLFDGFPDGSEVLGGAPFNVAWHLQALGDQPKFVSSVGLDEQGDRIRAAMVAWGMSTSDLQDDDAHPTGRVRVEIRDGEPHYEIEADAAYDFIDPSETPRAGAGDLVYHGSLALRNAASREAFEACTADPACSIFVDVNLRPPWWRQAEVEAMLERARWAKMNEAELHALGFGGETLDENMRHFQERFRLEQLIVTRGREGATVSTATGEVCSRPPPAPERVVDSVGAGDSFSAAYLHGMRAGWPIERTLDVAQRLASMIIGIRGATPTDRSFYASLLG